MHDSISSFTLCNLKSAIRALMKHLFTYGPVPITETARVSLKETEIGPVPEGWRVVELGSQVDVKGGKRLPRGHEFAGEPTPYPYVRVADFKENSIDTSALKFLKPEDRDAIKRYIITSNDVYISIAGTIGLVGTVPPELDGANLTENAARLAVRKTSQLDRNYLALYLDSEGARSEIALRAFKTSQPKLALARIKQVPMALPPVHDQREIAACVEFVRRKTRSEEKRKAALQALSKTMLHHLMTGKIRVKDL